jgi:type I restriction enzyme, S subunit
MKWDEQTLGQICDRERGLIQTGPFGSQLHQSDYREEGIPVVMPQDIVKGRINLSSVAKVAEETADRLARHKLKVGAIVMPRRGEINKRAFIKESEQGYLCGTGCIKIELVGTVLEPHFLYYYLEQPQIVSWIEQHAVGTTMLNLNTTIIRDIPIQFPALETQHKAVSILSAYDDLIENSRRRMALLEESARLLYQEWFVRLRFPGYEHIRITSGVPEGWERTAFERALVLQRGFDLPIQAREDGEVPIYGSTGINGFHNKAKVPGPGVVTGRSGTLGEVHYVAGDFWPLNTALWVKEFKRVTSLFSLFLMRKMDLKQYNGGVSVPTLDRKTVHRVEVLIPPKSLLAVFDEFVVPLFEQMENLTLQNQKLRTASDLLLPKLMSGEITV